MHFYGYHHTKWILWVLALSSAWLASSYLEDYQLNQRWEDSLAAKFERMPTAYRTQYNQFLATYENKPPAKIALNGTYVHTNKLLNLEITFEKNGRVVINRIRHDLNLHGRASATYQLMGSTLVFSDVKPSSSTWFHLGDAWDAQKAFPFKRQAIEIISDREIRWVGLDGHLSLVKQ